MRLSAFALCSTQKTPLPSWEERETQNKEKIKKWRRRVGIEPTRDSANRLSPGLKPGPVTRRISPPRQSYFKRSDLKSLVHIIKK